MCYLGGHNVNVDAARLGAALLMYSLFKAFVLITVQAYERSWSTFYVFVVYVNVSNYVRGLNTWSF